MRGGSRKGRTPNRSRRGCREIGGGWKGGMGESRNGQPKVLGIRKKGPVGVVRGGPEGRREACRRSGGCLEGGK